MICLRLCATGQKVCVLPSVFESLTPALKHKRKGHTLDPDIYSMEL